MRISLQSAARRRLPLLARWPARRVACCTRSHDAQQSNPGQLSAATAYVPANAQLLVNGAIGGLRVRLHAVRRGQRVFSPTSCPSPSRSTTNLRLRPPHAPDESRRTERRPAAATSSRRSTRRCRRRAARPTRSLAKLRGWTDAEMPTGVNRTRLIGQAAAYAGYSLVLLGEGMCSAAINVGPELTPAQLFAEAKTPLRRGGRRRRRPPTMRRRSTSRLLGRARTLLNLGKPRPRRVDAAKIPAGFVVNMSTRRASTRGVRTSRSSSINQNSWSTVDRSLPRSHDQRRARSARRGDQHGPQRHGVGHAASGRRTSIRRFAHGDADRAICRSAADRRRSARGGRRSCRARRRRSTPRATRAPACRSTARRVKRRRRCRRRSSRSVVASCSSRDIASATSVAATCRSSRRRARRSRPAAAPTARRACFPLPDVERINNPNIPKT